MNTTKEKMRKEIVEKYVLLMRELFDLLNNSNVMTEMNHPSHCLHIGINSIHRVFENTLMKTKNLRKAYFYAQKSQYYYLEYIEQVYKSNFSLNLNYVDIVVFIYKKTIFRSEAEEEHQENIIDFIEDEVLQLDEEDGKHMFIKMIKTTNILLYWENMKLSFETRRKICDTYLSIYLLNDNVDLTYVEIIQEKIKMNDNNYTDFLKEIIERHMVVSKPSKKKTRPEIEKQERIFMKFYTNENTFLEKFEKGNMFEFVNWVYM